MLNAILKERDLLSVTTMADGSPATPANWVLHRAEMLEALKTYSYGLTPAAPQKVWGEVESEEEILEGKMKRQQIRLSFETENGVFSYPVTLQIPMRTEKPAVILHINFGRGVPEAPGSTVLLKVEDVPVEAIGEAGFAVASLCYTDMVNDNKYGDYSDGIAAHFGTTIDRAPTEWGKIGMWAYGASRALDYLLTRSDLDAARTAVVGHSRLGKTALWTAAQDERFWAAISNESGYGGAATSKHGQGERVRDFLDRGSWDWYCENFKQFTDEKEDDKPYDQAWLLALIAPRYLCVGSASLDTGADPKSEFLTTLWASQAWETLGKTGLVGPTAMPQPGDEWKDGCVGYHLREGKHFLAEEDWMAYLRFLKDKRG